MLGIFLEYVKPVVHIIIRIYRLIFRFGGSCEEFACEIITRNYRSANRVGIISYPMIGSNNGVISGIPTKFFQPQEYGLIG